MPTEDDVLAAVLAAINDALPDNVQAYEPSKVPSPRPNDFVSVTVARRAGGAGRGGRYATTGWSVYVMAASSVALYGEDRARNSLRLAGTALENNTLIVADEKSTPARFDNARPVAPDDGWFSGVTTYTFAI